MARLQALVRYLAETRSFPISPKVVLTLKSHKCPLSTRCMVQETSIRMEEVGAFP